MADMSARRDPKPEAKNKPTGAPQEGKTKSDVVSSATEAQQDARNTAEKGWFNEYVYSTPSEWGDGALGWGGAAIGTIGKWLTAKPVEGIVTTGTGSVIAGKIARWGTVLAAAGVGAYFLWPHLVAGVGPGLSDLARETSSTLSDTVTAEAGGASAATDAANSLGDYGNTLIDAPAGPPGGGGALRVDPPISSPGEITGGGTQLPPIMRGR